MYRFKDKFFQTVQNIIVTINRWHVLTHVSQNFKETNLPKKKKIQSHGYKMDGYTTGRGGGGRSGRQGDNKLHLNLY